MRSICSVESCDGLVNGHGFCDKHYRRWRKHGHPEGGRTHASPEERFRRLTACGEANECWLWQGKLEKTGYGRFQPGGKGSPLVSAHRFAHLLATGERPPVVMHTCDNRQCVNPAHLRSGTYKENTADMFAKGRAKPARALGNANYNTKLTPDDVRTIRQRQGESAASVGRDFGVGHKTILAIWRGITWKHID